MYNVSNDTPALVRNSNLNEELGQVSLLHFLLIVTLVHDLCRILTYLHMYIATVLLGLIVLHAD